MKGSIILEIMGKASIYHKQKNIVFHYSKELLCI